MPDGGPQPPPSGKIGCRALPSPQRIAAPTYEPLQTSLERMIAKVRREQLSVDPVGLHDNLLALGGHPLLVPGLQARLRASLGREMSMQDAPRRDGEGALDE